MTDDARRNRAAALLSVASNALLTAVKLAIGLVTGSVAVLSEAANSAGDLIASAIAFAGVRAAARPPDADHPYGHEKSENLAAAIEGVLVLAAGAAVAAEAVRRLVSGSPEIAYLDLAVAVMAASAVVNLVVAAAPAAGRTANRVAGDRGRRRPPGVRRLDLGRDRCRAGARRPHGLDRARRDRGARRRRLRRVRRRPARLARRPRPARRRACPRARSRSSRTCSAAFEREGVSFHALRGRRAGAKRLVDLHMVVPPDTTVRRGHAMSGRVKGAVRAALPGTEVLIHLEDH